jgi:ubiquinone/menaquinone biosynthesis C-methylase UbiE
MTTDPTDIRTAVQFNDYMKRYPELYRAMALQVREHVKASDPVILDVGCGSGLLSLELRRLYPQGVMVGLDPLRNMLGLAVENMRDSGLEQLNLVQGVSEALPLCSGKVDVVVSRFSLPYWPDPKRSFLEIHRVLKPGGFLVLEALNKEFSGWRLGFLRVLMRLRAAPMNVITYHLDAYKLAHTWRWVEDHLTTSGFEIVHVEGRPKDWKFLVVARIL